MATLTRTRPSSTSFHSESHHNHALSLDVPKPFPSRAEREQAELLESLALEDLQLGEEVGLVAGPSAISSGLEGNRVSEVCIFITQYSCGVVP